MNAVAFFCEDVREEKGGSHALIGVFGDNFVAPAFPGGMPKLCIFIRINCTVDFEPVDLQIFFNDGRNRLLVNTIDRALFEKSIADAICLGLPLAGIYAQVVAAPFQVNEPTLVQIEMDYDGKTQSIGLLNFVSPDMARKITNSGE